VRPVVVSSKHAKMSMQGWSARLMSQGSTRKLAESTRHASWGECEVSVRIQAASLLCGNKLRTSQGMEMLYGTALADTGNVVGHFLNVLVNGAQGTEKSIHALAESGQFNGIILENARYAMHRCAEMLAQHILRYHNNVVSDYERRLKEASSAETLCALNKDAPDAKRQKLTHDARDETSENPVKEKPGMCAVGSGKTDEEVANGFLATSL